MKRLPAAPIPADEPVEIWIDVSAHQGEIDWPQVARAEAFVSDVRVGPVVGVIVRVGEGKDVDRYAVRNLQAAHAAGLRIGVYQYFRADRDGATQAAQILETLRVAGVPVEFVAVDREAGEDDNLPAGIVDGTADIDPRVVTREALDLCAALELAGLRVWIYAGQWIHWEYSQRRPELIEPFARWPLWVPSYSSRAKAPMIPVNVAGKPHPWPTWAAWQFAGSEGVPGRVAGVRGRVDVNRVRVRFLERPAEAVVPSPSLLAEARDELHAIALRLKAAHPVEAAAVLRAADEIAR